MTTGTNNVGVGRAVMPSLTTGSLNVATGQSALFSNTTGVANVATGRQALLSNTTGVANVATGYQALLSNPTGSLNIATGRQALLSNTTGDENIATGIGALNSNTTGNDNVATGRGALSTNTTGDDNVATGNFALFENTTGNRNIATGIGALSSNARGSENVATGNFALSFNATGNRNIAIGSDALTFNRPAPTTSPSARTPVGSCGRPGPGRLSLCVRAGESEWVIQAATFTAGQASGLRLARCPPADPVSALVAVRVLLAFPPVVPVPIRALKVPGFLLVLATRPTCGGVRLTALSGGAVGRVARAFSLRSLLLMPVSLGRSWKTLASQLMSAAVNLSRHFSQTRSNAISSPLIRRSAPQLSSVTIRSIRPSRRRLQYGTRRAHRVRVSSRGGALARIVLQGCGDNRL